jgi:hypothetical protein
MSEASLKKGPAFFYRLRWMLVDYMLVDLAAVAA